MDTQPTNNETSHGRRLERPDSDRVLGGVAAGVAAHTGASVGLVRLGFLIAALFGGFGVLLYLAAWVLIPPAEADSSAAERWLANLTTPGKRLGAFLIGIAALVILTGAAPLTILAAATLLAAAALLSNDTTTGPVIGPGVGTDIEHEGSR
jgi:phage shock protein PspC (stress-responsive transcriptional regulator)